MKIYSLFPHTFIYFHYSSPDHFPTKMTNHTFTNIQINRNNNPSESISNPYILYKSCCINFNIKDHVRLCGVISFSLFICLIIISTVLFGILSLFYIVTGAIIKNILLFKLMRIYFKYL
ncbi:hypothetical protein Mgra_00004249 [Meloidogyne graminicola]|uniref:Uncharacterized protein n=1 Tax=Meloidogyne graminicola TaxID=189291 RepID=A0A8S9ZRM3_9BILA|nr:hypothetical protein Mgra_00004249 [Meloidogyne graminicola]